MIKYTKFNSPIGTLRLYSIGKAVYFISLPNYNKEYIREWFKKNLNFISMIKSYFIQLAIILANTTGVIVAIFMVYLIRHKGYKY